MTSFVSLLHPHISTSQCSRCATYVNVLVQQSHSLWCARHGARTPLTDNYWAGATWDTGTDCGQQFEAVRIAVRDLAGEPQPPASHDASQVLPLCCRPSVPLMRARLLLSKWAQWPPLLANTMPGLPRC